MTKQSLQIQELAIAIAAKNLNPAAINPDVIKYTNIIPAEWELAQQPLYSNNLVQVIYKNGIGIIIEPNRINVVEIIGGKPPAEVQIAKIAHQLVDKLSQIDYQAIGINPKGFSIFPSETAAYQYLCGKLLAPGLWQEFRGSKVNPSLRLNYPFDKGGLNIDINQVSVQLGEVVNPAILFSGNLNYPLVSENINDRIKELQTVIDKWQNSVGVFQKFILDKFLEVEETPKSASVFQ